MQMLVFLIPIYILLFAIKIFNRKRSILFKIFFFFAIHCSKYFIFNLSREIPISSSTIAFHFFYFCIQFYYKWNRVSLVYIASFPSTRWSFQFRHNYCHLFNLIICDSDHWNTEYQKSLSLSLFHCLLFLFFYAIFLISMVKFYVCRLLYSFLVSLSLHQCNSFFFSYIFRYN